MKSPLFKDQQATQNIISKDRREIISSFLNNENMFITGGAGTGKSHLLNQLRQPDYVNDFAFNQPDYFSQIPPRANNLDVTASTGIAAVNVSGTTIHSWAGAGFGNSPVNQILDNLFSARMHVVRKRIRFAKALAIDEISMISAEFFDLLDVIFREVRGIDAPMGGIQMVLFGDFLQLPPVSTTGNSALCFESKVWQDLNLTNFVLKDSFRQNDQNFFKMLERIRFGEVSDEDKELLNQRISAPDFGPIKATTLTTHNAKALEINETHLDEINAQEVVYEAQYHGDASKMEFLRKNCIANDLLKLRVGAQVMMIRNTFQKDGIINGSLGIVRSFSTSSKYPVVEFANGVVITIPKEEWVIEKFDHEKGKTVIEARKVQIPLLLSWAITVHKSQGLTLDKISCDLSSVFSPGQIYVALSRARSLDSIFIKSINYQKIKADPKAVSFYKSL